MAIINGVAKSADAGFYPKEIEQSLRFEDGSSAYLSRTPASAGNRKTWTWSGWVKRGNLGTGQVIFSAGDGANLQDLNLDFTTTDNLRLWYRNGGTLQSSSVYRDSSAWYHVVAVWDSANSTSTERMILYVNGVRLTSFSTESYPAQNTDGSVNSTSYGHSLGRRLADGLYYDGYLSEVHFTDGTAYDATAFGEFKNGVWVAKEPDVNYGTNGFYLKFDSNTNDSSGNGNNWTANNLSSTDYMLDSPTNNFATLNPLDQGTTGGVVFAEGNLKVDSPLNIGSFSTNKIPSGTGKYYYEVYVGTLGGASSMHIGVGDEHFNPNWVDTRDSFTYYREDGAYDGGTVSSYTTGDVLGVLIDSDVGTVAYYKNNSLQVSLGKSYSLYSPFITTASNSGAYAIANFGQDSSFAGNKTPQGYTDANGIGDFYYEPPTGYVALCTANLPEPVIGPNSASTSDESFNIVLYTGDGTSSNAITGVGFQPDFLWIKARADGYYHNLQNVISGAPYRLESNTTGAEQYATNTLLSFDSDGFTVGSGAGHNASGRPFVAWNWKANGSGSTNTDGTITSTVSANVDAGFSIVAYTGNGSAGATVGHGLNSAPDVIILKRRNAADSWMVYHSANTSAPETDFLRLQATDATADYAAAWNDTAPTTSVFTVGSDSAVNLSASTYIALCWHEVEGFSKFGSYTGNGSTDGPFVFTNFRPALVICKLTSAANDSWRMYDNKRLGYNPNNSVLYPNLSNAEDSSTNHVELLSNGFKLRSDNNNLSGHTYIYMAFAECPTKYSLGR